MRQKTLVPNDRRLNAQLTAFLELPVAACVLDRELRFVAVNDALAAMNGLSPDAHLGRRGPDLLPDLDPGAWTTIRRVVETGVPAGYVLCGTTPATQELRMWQEQYHPWVDRSSGEVLGVIVTAVDVTDQRAFEGIARRRAQQIRGIGMLAAELVGIANEAELGQLLCRYAAELLGSAAAAVAVGRPGQPIRVIAAAGYPDEERPARLGEGTALADTARTGVGHALTAGPEWDEQFPAGASYHRKLGLAAMITAPLLSADETIGALGVAFTERALPAEDERWTLATLATVGSQAMERARNVEQRRRSDALRDAFIDVMGHELKTPLSTIYGGLLTLNARGNALPPESRDELFADALGEAQRLVELVDDVVALSRLERGVEIDLSEPLMLSHLTQRVVEGLPADSSANVSVTVEHDIPPAQGEAGYVGQVVRNLLTNARKYGKPPLELVVSSTDDEVQVRLLDRGPGLPPEVDKLFDLYYRAPSTAGRASGSGIGLFVCRELVRLMGGRTWAVNREGGGAEFGFALQAWRDEDADL